MDNAKAHVFGDSMRMREGLSVWAVFVSILGWGSGGEGGWSDGEGGGQPKISIYAIFNIVHTCCVAGTGRNRTNASALGAESRLQYGVEH